MLPLLLSILAGLGSSSGWGEEPRALVLSAQASVSRFEVEASWSDHDKVETGDGWIGRVGADVWAGPVSVGAHYAHRWTSAWTKDRLILRGSARYKALRVLGEWAPRDEQNRVRRVEARVSLPLPARVLVETRYWYGWHAQGEGWGAAVLVGLRA